MSSTFRAYEKHKLSFDPVGADWQSPAMGIGERIALARKAAGWSQARLSQEIGTAQTTISSWERERTEPTRDDVQRVATVLGVSPSQLELDEAGPSLRTVPVVGYVGAGAVAHYYAGGDGGLDDVPAPANATPNTVAAEIRGESLGPLLDGWLVYWDEVRNPPTPDMLGRLCVVGLVDERVLVKQLKASAVPGRFHLLSNNEGPIFDAEVTWAALVKSMTPR